MVLPVGPVGKSWFEVPREQAAPVGVEAPLPDLGHPLLSSLAGMVGGIAGGVAAVFVAHCVARQMHSEMDVTSLVASAVRRFPSLTPSQAIVAITVTLGALVGALYGRVTRRFFRVVPRLLFPALALPALWTAIHLLVLARYAPHVARGLPLVPVIFGTVIYAVFVGIVPPWPDRRSMG